MEVGFLSDIITPIVLELGVGGIGGFIVGYTIKKMVKIVTIMIGIFLSALIYFSYSEVITINYVKFNELVSNSIPIIVQAPGILAPIISSLPIAGSFILGLTLGYKKG
jgi:uncharacterized membrane protein (Fun14 family)